MNVSFPIHLTLPLPPSKNECTILVKKKVAKKKVGGKDKHKRRTRYVPKRAPVVKEYHKNVALLIAEAGHTDVLKGYKGRVGISCEWYVRTLRQDAANFHWQLNDALKGPLGIDDRHFLTRDWNVFRDPENPRVEVWIAPLPHRDAEAERYAERLRKERKRRRKEAKE